MKPNILLAFAEALRWPAKGEPKALHQLGCRGVAHFGHAAISELSLLSGVKRKLDFEPAKGSFWREADKTVVASFGSPAV